MIPSLKFNLFNLLNIFVWITGCNYVDKSSNVNFFRYNEDANISTLDPAFVRNQAEIWASSQLFDPLLEFDDSLNLIPCVAKKWRISENKKKITFILHSNFYFSNPSNQKLNNVKAKDVVFSLQRVADFNNGSPGSWIFSNCINHDLLYQKDSLSPFVALNDTTFIINLTEQNEQIFMLLAMPYCRIVMEQKSIKGVPKGSGPFNLVDWKSDNYILMHKNKFYPQYDKNKIQLPYLDGVYIELNKNKQNAFMGFMNQSLDFYNGVNLTTKDELFDKKGKLKTKYVEKINCDVSPFLNVEFIAFNLDSNFMDLDPEKQKILRKSLDLATNKENIVSFLKNGIGIPAYSGFVPFGITLYDQKRTNNSTLDINTAKENMKFLGFNEKNRLVMHLHTVSDYADIAVLLKNQWQNIFVDLIIEIQPGSHLRKLRNNGSIFLYRGSWIADYPDPENFFACFYGPNKSPVGPNYTHFSNSTFDSLYLDCKKQIHYNDKLANYLKMDYILKEEVPIISLFYDKSVRLSQKQVVGLNPNPMNFLNLKTVRKTINSKNQI